MGATKKWMAAVAAAVMATTLSIGSASGAEPVADPPELETRQPAQQRAAAVIDLPEFVDVPCLHFTDSIVRLYSAYFLRAPDRAGFEFWHDVYLSGEWSLPRMSAFFSQSDEFVQRYGSFTDAEFIDLLYRNIFERAADPAGRDYWLGRMQNEGLDRGTVMLFFSESPEYITQTDTALTPAGHFSWYPEGTQFTCGYGSMSYEILVQPSYLDVVVFNFEETPATIRYEVLQAGEWTLVQETTLNTGGYLHGFGWPMVGNSITAIRLTGTGSFNWSIAHSPTITPATRAGWLPA